MKRAEIMAIIGQYSREGFTAHTVTGGLYLDGIGYRTIKQARRDTGINQDTIRIRMRDYRPAA